MPLSTQSKSAGHAALFVKRRQAECHSWQAASLTRVDTSKPARIAIATALRQKPSGWQIRADSPVSQRVRVLASEVQYDPWNKPHQNPPLRHVYAGKRDAYQKGYLSWFK